jgi:hypothetical protein
MTLVEYLKMRQQVETAPPEIVKEASELAEIVKTRNTELISVDRMWNSLIELAEERYPGPPKLKVIQ